MSQFGDTVAAIATPLGVGAIGVVRVSGGLAQDILGRIFVSGTPLRERMVRLGRIVEPGSGEVVDEACAVFFKGPRSFTGEDVVEFQCHGNPLILKAVLAAVLACGARLAEAGEFTRQALLNGKMDLSRAEAVSELIHAVSFRSRGVALNRLKGRLFSEIQALRMPLIRMLEQMEGAMDFPDEVPAVERPVFLADVESALARVSQLLALQDYGRLVDAGVQCVIVGAPNAGKSSFLNRMLGESRAIVTSTPGTTRDFIEGATELGGLLFRWVDTAGIRDSQDTIERLGMRKVRALLTHADLVVGMVDGTRSFSAAIQAIYVRVRRRPGVWVVTKQDLKRQRLLVASLQRFLPHWPVFQVSSKTGAGFEELKTWLVDRFSQSAVSGDALVCNARQAACLRQIKDRLESLRTEARSGLEDAVLAISLKQVVMGLGELTGEEITEAVLDGIFSRFCVGK